METPTIVSPGIIGRNTLAKKSAASITNKAVSTYEVLLSSKMVDAFVLPLKTTHPVSSRVVDTNVFSTEIRFLFLQNYWNQKLLQMCA